MWSSRSSGVSLHHPGQRYVSLSAIRGLIAATLAVAGGVGSGLAGDGGGLLQRGLQVEGLRQQDAGGTGTELHARDVLRH